MRRTLPFAISSIVLLLCSAAMAPSSPAEEAVEQDGDRVVIDALLDGLQQPDEEIHQPAADALIAMGSKSVDAVVTLLSSDDVDTTIRAARVLSQIGDRRAMEPLARLYHDSDEPTRRKAAMSALAAIARNGGHAPSAGGMVDAVAAIDGHWDSQWGPMRLHARRENGVVKVTGGWQQGPGMQGRITRGTFDPATRVFEFDFDEPWHAMSGTATLNMAADGRNLSGTWQFNTGGGGTWTMHRPDLAVQ